MNIDQSRFSNQSGGFSDQGPDLVTAREAASLLGVKLPTLYAYASRGLVGRVAGPDGRESLYSRADLERLKARALARAGHGVAAAAALRWGEPVLETAISSITAAGPFYRGVSAVELARGGVPLESAASLLWTGSLPPTPPVWERPALSVPAHRLASLVPAGTSPLAALALAVPALALRDPGRFAVTPEAEQRLGERLLGLMAALAGLGSNPAGVRPALSLARTATARTAATLAIALGAPGSPAALRALDAALVLSADHELNASTFAARVAASTGADLYACVGAALAALSGPVHGGACDRVEALVAETVRPARAGAVVNERSRRGESIPGFGHTLYPRGDPRAAPLLELARKLPSKAPALATLLALVEAMRDAGREPPTIDSGLVAVTLGLGLPSGSAAGIFAIGRAAGWIAHILEQRAAGFLIRPRARYVGAALAAQ